MQSKASFLKSKLGFDNMFTVDNKGLNGGLMLLWKSELRLEVQNFSQRHVNAIIHLSEFGPSWKFTGFYGNSKTAKRMESWSLMRFLSGFQPVPWLCIGDFNEIVSLSEKSSSTRRSNGQMYLFQSALIDYNLQDLRFKGSAFTWSNGRSGKDLTLERLDTAVANSEWSLIFYVVEVIILPRYQFDHSPLLISFNNSSNVPWQCWGCLTSVMEGVGGQFISVRESLTS
jgi:hypothetical protein